MWDRVKLPCACLGQQGIDPTVRQAVGSARSSDFLEFVIEHIELFTPGHHFHEFFPRDLVTCKGAETPATVEDGESIADGKGMVDVMGDEDHG